jgi:hypothetical protein
MKPRLIALIVVASVVGIAVNLGLAIWLVRGLHRPMADQRVAQKVAVAEAFAPELDNAFQGVAPVAPAGAPCAKEELQALRGQVVPARDCAVSGPFTHANLSIYLIHGPDTLKGQKVMTLQAALEQNLVVVHEGRMAIDNRGTVPVFIQAGDIIKGGNQDRVLPYDQLVPPQTTGAPLVAFCVESGRSFPRGQELSSAFQSATEQLPGKQLNLAARYRQSQAEVWNGVRQTQLALAQNVGASVQSPQSQTSLQLTLENQRVHQAIQDYLNELAPLPAGKKDVIGFAVAVNGQIQNAEVYASSALFGDLWPKLVKASAVAALAERQRGAAAAPSKEAVQQFLADGEAGQAFQQTVGNRNLVIRQETDRQLLFDTCDPTRQNLVLHRSYLAK